MKQVVMGEVRWSAQRRFSARENPRAHHRQHAFAEQTHSALRRRGFRQVADRDVDVGAIQVDHAIVRGNVHLDLRMSGAKALEPRNDPQRRERHRRR